MSSSEKLKIGQTDETVDDDEENDEDYQPHEAENDDDDEMNNVAVDVDTLTPSHLSSLQVKQVDEAFEALFGYEWGTRFQLPENPSLWTVRERALCRMLGPSAAASVLQSGCGRSFKTIFPCRKRQTYKIKLTAVAGTKEKTQVRSAEFSAAPAAASVAQPAGGVDYLLKKLAGSEKVSTVAKTSSDWDKFKETTGLGEKLEEQAESNQAFLKRQDFLTRVDNRKFELEKQERDKTRAKRGK